LVKSPPGVKGGFRSADGGLGNIALDPRFVNPSREALDFRLRPDSPCIDAGMFIEGGPFEDFEGDARPFRALPSGVLRGDHSGWDIGADEFIGAAVPATWELIQAHLLARPLDPVPPDLDQNADAVLVAADFLLALQPGT